MWAKLIAWNLAKTLAELPVWFERLRWIGRRKPEPETKKRALEGRTLTLRPIKSAQKSWRDGRRKPETKLVFDGDMKRIRKQHQCWTEAEHVETTVEKD